ncbi:MAG: pitrilysin family protein [Candidatus Staskawiczbacteria bacterium]|nr:pitrilysin family protein [Candidatus Staskawiczbacteria bacterium]
MNSYNKTILNNGLRVITIPMENANSVTVLILVGTGSKYETKDINGISHFLEHMFFKGTEKRPNTLKISETLDSVGGEYNAFTSKEVTGFWAKVDKKHFGVALDWISDIFLNSKFDEKEMEREKGVIIEEMNMYLDTPTAYVGDLWEKLLYDDQPAGWMVIGEKENILSFNRKKVLDYYKSHYSPSNVIICVAGGVKSKEAEEKIKSYFGKAQKAKTTGKNKAEEIQKEPKVLLHYKKTDQTHFCLGVRAYNLFDEKRYALALLSIILGGNMSSRLFIKVRERNGLAYSIHTSTDTSTDTGYLVTQAGIDHKNLEKAMGLILQEYRDLRDKKITEKELQKAKDYLKGTTSLSLDSSDHQASFYGAQELLEKNILTPEEKFKKIDEVSINDIKKVAEDIFVPEKLNLAVVGPVEEKDSSKLEQLLKL